MFLKLWQVIKPGDGLIKQGAAWKALDKSTRVFHIYCPVECQHFLPVTFRVLLQGILLIKANVSGQWIVLHNRKCAKSFLICQAKT